MIEVTFENLNNIQANLITALTSPNSIVKLQILEEATFTGEENSIENMDLVKDSYSKVSYGRLLSFSLIEEKKNFKDGRKDLETFFTLALDDEPGSVFEITYINGEEASGDTTKVSIEVIGELKPPF